MSWNSGDTTNLRHMISHGLRYTHDARDLNSNLNATGSAYTELPRPYYDSDDDNGDRRWEEAEITVEETVFPINGVNYYSRLHFMRWFKSCPQCNWQWDSGGGTIRQVGQLSRTICGPPCDKYDADPNYNGYTLGDLGYPSQSQPSSLAEVTEAHDRMASLEDAKPVADPAPARLAGGITRYRTADPGEIAVRADLSRGLMAYAASARALAKSVVSAGQARGVVTFAQPLSRADLEALEDFGLEILSVEAVTAEYDGRRGTYFGLYSAAAWSEMEALEAELSVTFLGITAAQVLVKDRATWEAVSGDERVFLVDLSIEQVRRETQSIDVVMNDLYWDLAGW